MLKTERKANPAICSLSQVFYGDNSPKFFRENIINCRFGSFEEMVGAMLKEYNGYSEDIVRGFLGSIGINAKNFQARKTIQKRF